MGKRVLVTGGAGFIGSHLVEALLARGHQVAVVDNLSTGRRENVPSGADFQAVDIGDPVRAGEVFERFRPEIVYHLAAQTSVRRSTGDPAGDASTNVVGSINVLDASVRTGVEKVVYASSGGAIYGEPDGLPVREDHPVRPLSPYGLSKYVVELYLRLYRDNHGLRYSVLRYPNVYGPRQDPYGEAGVVAIFSRTLLAGERPVIFGDGRQTRDYVYVADVVEASLLCLERGGDGVYNLGWGREVSVLELLASLQEVLGTDVPPRYDPPRPGEVSRICLDASRAKEELGWQPTTPLAEGLRLTARWVAQAG
ncbi:MAG: NAD-dependent epimerase/dehydratase family protein [Bacillota bacterium]|nr:NAD-dependent epimerase/dehydratase family protein [Bacillota bacterium]